MGALKYCCAPAYRSATFKSLQRPKARGQCSSLRSQLFKRLMNNPLDGCLLKSFGKMWVMISCGGETFVAWESNKRNSASPKARRAERAGASESQTGEGERQTNFSTLEIPTRIQLKFIRDGDVVGFQPRPILNAPTEYRPPARGCDEGATPGKHPKNSLRFCRPPAGG